VAHLEPPARAAPSLHAPGKFERRKLQRRHFKFNEIQFILIYKINGIDLNPPEVKKRSP
jgi:hypothetical protein